MPAEWGRSSLLFFEGRDMDDEFISHIRAVVLNLAEY